MSARLMWLVDNDNDHFLHASRFKLKTFYKSPLSAYIKYNLNRVLLD